MYIVWIDNSPIIGSSETSESKKILLRKSVDNGNTFDETSILSSNNSVDSINQEITATGNNVYVVWQDTPLAALKIPISPVALKIAAHTIMPIIAATSTMRSMVV